MAIREIEVVTIPVSDQDRAKAFYVDVLGLDLVRDMPFSEDRRWIQVAPRGSRSSITLATWFPGMAPGSFKGLTLAVDDIEATVAQLAANGLSSAQGIETAPGGRFVQIDDPDGNGLILQQDAESG